MIVIINFSSAYGRHNWWWQRNHPSITWRRGADDRDETGRDGTGRMTLVIELKWWHYGRCDSRAAVLSGKGNRPTGHLDTISSYSHRPPHDDRPSLSAFALICIIGETDFTLELSHLDIFAGFMAVPSNVVAFIIKCFHHLRNGLQMQSVLSADRWSGPSESQFIQVAHVYAVTKFNK